MFFLNLHKEKSNKRVSLIAKIILVILLFCVITNKWSTFNVSQDITRIQTINMDFIINEILMFSRFSFNYSFFMALGLVGVLVGVIFAITCWTLSTSQDKQSNESVKEHSYTIDDTKSLYAYNIYLINNQFIC